VTEVERSPFVLPPPPESFLLTAPGQAVPIEQPPAEAWLDGYIRSFSASSIRMLKICPEQYRQRYILGRKERPGGSLTLGSAVHSAVSHSHTQKVVTHADLPVTEVVEYFHDEAWPKAIEADGGVEEIRWDDGVEPDDYRRDGERMTQAYHHTVSPRVQPVAPPERRIDLYVPGVPVPFIGYLDVEEEGNVVDLKTGKQVQRKPDSNWRMQGQIYSLATGKPTHFHSVSRAKTPSIATPLTDPEMALPYRDDVAEWTRKVLVDYAGQVEYFMHRYGPDNAWPTSGLFMDYRGGAACRFCGFRKFCPAWEHERTVVVPGA
jgi:hypothetical protein